MANLWSRGLLIFCFLWNSSVFCRKELAPEGGSESRTLINTLYSDGHLPTVEYHGNYGVQSELNFPSIGSSSAEKLPKYSYVLKRRPRIGPEKNPKLYHITGVKRLPDQNPRDYQPRQYQPQFPHVTPTETEVVTKTEGKKYAFAYAVRPKDGYTTVGEDFNLSHKESRDGKTTIGEYKVLLPDGRLQVVRYTADGTSGFKADVTYEGTTTGVAVDHQSQERVGNQRHVSKPNVDPPLPLAPPAFKSRTFSSPGLRTHPSLSPSLYYTNSIQDHHVAQPVPSYTPSEVSPGLYKIPSPSHSPKSAPPPAYQTFKRAIHGPTLPTLSNLPTYQYEKPTPKSIYDKIHHTPQTSHYTPVTFGQRAGPATNPPPPAPPAEPPKNPRSYNPTFNSGSTDAYSPPLTSGTPQSLRNPAYVKYTPQVSAEHYDHHPVQPLGYEKGSKVNVAKPPFSIGNVQNDFFRAGPTGPSSKVYDQGPITVQNEHGDHFILEEVHDHADHLHDPQDLTFPGRSEFNSKTSLGGAVYFETPATGSRPTPLGVKDRLAQLPLDNLPRPNISTRTYELGSKDYGQTVGYSPTGGFDGSSPFKEFKPSQLIPQHVLSQYAQPQDYVLRTDESRITAKNSTTL